MNFKKWVKSIQTVDYNGALTVYVLVNWIPLKEMKVEIFKGTPS